MRDIEIVVHRFPQLHYPQASLYKLACGRIIKELNTPLSSWSVKYKK